MNQRLIGKTSYLYSPLSLALVSISGFTEIGVIKNPLILTSIILLVTFINKIIYDLRNNVRIPIAIIVILPTFAMSGMLISTKFIDCSYSISHGVWYLFFGLHLLTMAIYYLRVFDHRTIATEFIPGNMVMFCGIYSAAISGSHYLQPKLNVAIIIFGFIHMLVFYPHLIIYLIKDKRIESIPAKMIIVAPFPLLYLDLMENGIIQSGVISNLLMLAILISLGYGISMLVKLKNQQFQNVYAAMTFPLAISTTAISEWLELNSDNSFIIGIFTIYQILVMLVVIYIAFNVIRNTIKEN